MTLHKFAGLEDGRHSKENLVHLLKTDEHFTSTVSRINNTDLLIIEEVLMISKRIWKLWSMFVGISKSLVNCLEEYRLYLVGVSSNFHHSKMNSMVTNVSVPISFQNSFHIL